MVVVSADGDSRRLQDVPDDRRGTPVLQRDHRRYGIVGSGGRSEGWRSRDDHDHGGTLAQLGLNFDPAPRPFHHLANQSQTQTGSHAARFGGVEHLEGAAFHVFGHAGSVVRDADTNPLAVGVVCRHCPDSNVPLASFALLWSRDGLARVYNQIQNGLRQAVRRDADVVRIAATGSEHRRGMAAGRAGGFGRERRLGHCHAGPLSRRRAGRRRCRWRFPHRNRA